MQTFKEISKGSIGDRDCQGPPISMLHNDILWRIFNINTPTEADITNRSIRKRERSLLTAIRTSQVCSRWRNLILSFSSLWANVINLRYLDQTNDNWRNKILKRTGSSPISVIGCLLDGRPATAFFLTLLRDHWTRLRRVCILVEEEGIVNHESWLSLRLPAPNLQILRLNFPTSPAFLTADDCLFSNDAPSIHTLIIHQITFNPSGCWLSHVRQLNLDGCSTRKTILIALTEMQSLEILAMTDIDIDIDPLATGNRHKPTIILPNLKFLSLSGDLMVIIFLLGHIAPTLGCSSAIESINTTLPVLSAEEASFLQQCFTAHFRSFSDFTCNKSISWTMTRDIFNLDNNLHRNITHPLSSGFYFRLEVDVGESWQGIPYIIIDSLSSCNLGFIKTFLLDIAEAALNPSDSQLARFFRSLPSVETMHTDSQTMELVLKAKDHSCPPTVFPALRTIIFDTDEELKSDAILRFLMWRRDAGIPIKFFDLSGCTSPKQEKILFLEGLDGLEVEWNEKIRSEI